MNKKLFFALVGLLCIFVGSMHSEENDDKNRKELFKSYKRMAHGNYAAKCALLNRIESDFDEMHYTADDKEFVRVLVYLSEEGVLRREYVRGVLSNDNFDVRVRAVRLLARVGGDDACAAICRLLCHERNINVLCAIFDSFVDVHDNGEGVIMQSILQSYRNQIRPEHTYLLSMVRSLKYVIGSSDTTFDMATDLLKEITQREDVKPIVREEARNEMKMLENFRENSDM